MSRRAWARRHGATAALVVLAAALGVGVWIDRGLESPDGGASDQSLLIGSLDPDVVDRVLVSRGDSLLELQRLPELDGGRAGWQLQVDGALEPADLQSVSQLLTTLQLARVERPVDSAAVDLDRSGLAHPELRFELAQQGRQHTIAIGAEAPASAGGRYARVFDPVARGEVPGSGRVVVVSRELVQSLRDATGKLRARKLLPGAGGGAVARLSVREPGGSERWQLEWMPEWGRGASGYRITAPGVAGGVRADWRTVEALLGALRGLEVDSFLPSARADAGLDEGLRLSVQMANPDATAELSLGGPCAGGSAIVVRRLSPSPVAGCVPADRLAALNVPAERLIDRHAVGAAESFVVELKLSRGRRSVEVARSGHGWIMRSPQQGQADPAAVDGWLSALLALSGELVASAGDSGDRGRFGFDAGQTRGRVVSLGGTGSAPDAGERIERLELGATEGDSVYLLRAEDRAVLRLDRREARVLEPDARPLRELTVLNFPVSRVVGIDVTAGPIVQRLDRTADGAIWQLVEPKTIGLAADAGLAGELVERIAKLRAVRWVEAAPVEQTGLDQPWCTVTLRLGADSDDTRPHAHDGDGEGEPIVQPADNPASTDMGPVRLRFGAVTTGGYFVQTSAEPAPFVVPKSVAQLACGWLLDRGALLLDTHKVAKVTLRVPGGGAPLVVAPSAERWVATRGDQEVPRAGAVVRESLAGLFADAVVRVGPVAAEERLDRPQLEIVVEQLAASGEPTTVSLRVGAGDAWQDSRVFYVRRAGVQATYAVAQARLRPLLELF